MKLPTVHALPLTDGRGRRARADMSAVVHPIMHQIGVQRAPHTHVLQKGSPVVLKRFLTRREFGAAYGVGFTKTHELINHGKIVAVKMGRKTLITIESAEAWAAALPPLKRHASVSTTLNNQ